MAEILFLTVNSGDTCSFYRSAGVVKDLRRKTDNNITLVQMDQVALNWSFITQFDLVFIQRAFSKDCLNLCGYIKQCGIPLWLDYDDDLFALNPENPTYYIYNNPETQANIKGMLGLADAVSVPTEYLRQAYSEFNKNIYIVPNAFHDLLFKRPDVMPKRTNNIVWRGPEAHIFDLMSYSREINNATKEFPEWRFMFMGFSPWFLTNTDNKGHIPSLDVVMYFKALLEMSPACVHVPLHDNMFNRCKSNIAYIESSYAGAVCVAPAWWNAPGSIPYTDGASYYEAIRSVLSGEVDKAKLNREAWEYICDVLLLSKVNDLRLKIINSLL
jgi:hypothetical protein